MANHNTRRLMVWGAWLVAVAAQAAAAQDSRSAQGERESAFPGVGLYGTPYATEAETAARIAQCRAHGIRLLIPSLSGGGTVIWKTDKAEYYPALKEKLAAGYDALAMLIRHAHAAGIKVYPSVAVCPGGRMIDEHPEWETRDRTGRPSSATTAGAVSLSYPEARRAKIALLMDLVTGYEIDGILLDYCRYPENSSKPEQKYGFYGYDPPLIEACRTIHGFDPRREPIDSDRWVLFNQMRAETVTSFVREFRDAVRQSGRRIRIGGFGDTDPEAEARSCGRDWAAWGRRGLIDDFFLATYTEPVPKMSDVVKRARQALGPNVVLLSALCPFQRFLKTNDEMASGARAQLAGGADGLWIYREDFLNDLNLWAGAKAASELVDGRRRGPTTRGHGGPMSQSELEKIKALFARPEPVVWLFTGDSITHGALHTHGGRSYVEHFAERVRWELQRRRDVVINTGISGDTVPGLLADLDHRVLRFRPAVVSVMMGMNDSARGREGREPFRAAYNSLLDRLRAESDALVVLHTPNPVTAAAREYQDVPAYAEIIREVAADRGVAMIDQDAMWRRRGTPLEYLLDDGTIHPNAFGHVLFAQNMFEALGIRDPAAPTCRLFVP